jgi:hypothetical protein
MRGHIGAISLVVLVLAMGVAPSPCAVAGWQENGNAICTNSANQFEIQIISDGTGGAIIVWTDERSGLDIYAQRVGAAGVVQWTVDGIAICAHQNNQSTAQMTSDGAGGAIVAWEDFRNGNQDIYAQRVDPEGTLLWDPDGVAISTATADQVELRMTSDGAGGAVITWHDCRDGKQDIYGQRVTSSGVPQWAAGGVYVCTGAASEEYPANSWKAASDGAGGTIIAWNDFRNGNWDVYAQRVDSAGNVGATISVVESCQPVTAFVVAQSYPNPFNPMCTIRYEIPKPGRVTLRVSDVAGKPVRMLVGGWREPGAYSEIWDGRTDEGTALPSGVYFYSVKAGDLVATRKMVVLR